MIDIAIRERQGIDDMPTADLGEGVRRPLLGEVASNLRIIEPSNADRQRTCHESDRQSDQQLAKYQVRPYRQERGER